MQDLARTNPEAHRRLCEASGYPPEFCAETRRELRERVLASGANGEAEHRHQIEEVTADLVRRTVKEADAGTPRLTLVTLSAIDSAIELAQERNENPEEAASSAVGGALLGAGDMGPEALEEVKLISKGELRGVKILTPEEFEEGRRTP